MSPTEIVPTEETRKLAAVAEAAAVLMACPQCSAALQETFDHQNGHAWALQEALARLSEGAA